MVQNKLSPKRGNIPSLYGNEVTKGRQTTFDRNRFKPTALNPDRSFREPHNPLARAEPHQDLPNKPITFAA